MKAARVALGMLFLFLGFGLVSGCASLKPSMELYNILELPGGVLLDMVWIPRGDFMMGANPDEQDAYPDESPKHSVVLPCGFMMAKYEVTMAQWQAVMGTAPWRGRPCVVEAPNNPAVYISWKDAQAFTEKLSKLTGSQCRLPTEAEWEYAARAGSSTRFYWGDDPAFEVIDAHAWWRRTALNTGEKYARPVGHKTANGWGLFDMAGNVHEWCQDWYGDYPTEASVNPVGAADGKRRVNRGGSWITYGGACRSARRGQDSPEAAYDDLGFRVVQVFWASSEDVK